VKSSIAWISFATLSRLVVVVALLFFSLSLSLSLSTRRERGDVGEDVEGKVEGKIGCVTLFFSLSQKNVVITTSDVVIISENDDSKWWSKKQQTRSGSRVVIIFVIIIIIIISKRAKIIGETTKSFGIDSVAKIRLRGRPNETRV
jgi:hypothetical protein